MRTLFTFPTSVFSRRARLALAHKGLEVDVVDARADSTRLDEARRVSPNATMPVLVDEGRVIGDSTAIAHYLDLAYPDLPALWPHDRAAAAAAIEIVSNVDLAMNTLADLGTRTWVLRSHAEWSAHVAERIARAQGAIDAVAARATSASLTSDASVPWGAAEIWTYSAAKWVAGMPARASSAPLVAQILTLGFRMPDALVVWTTQHDARPGARAVFG